MFLTIYSISIFIYRVSHSSVFYCLVYLFFLFYSISIFINCISFFIYFLIFLSSFLSITSYSLISLSSCFSILTISSFIVSFCIYLLPGSHIRSYLAYLHLYSCGRCLPLSFAICCYLYSSRSFPIDRAIGSRSAVV